MMKTRMAVVIALCLVLAAMPASGAVTLMGALETCEATYLAAANVVGPVLAESGLPLPALPALECRTLDPENFCPPSGSCRALRAGTYYVPGDFTLAEALRVIGPGDLLLLVGGAFTLSGTIETTLPLMLPRAAVDGPSVTIHARSIHIEPSGLIRAADGADGRNLIAKTPDVPLRGADGGNGGSILLSAEEVQVEGALVPGDGGRGGDSLGLLGTSVRGGDGGSGGTALVATPSGARVLAGGDGADGGSAYSMGDAILSLSLNPCPDCAPVTKDGATCSGRWCLTSFGEDAAACENCLLVGVPANEPTCALENAFCVLPPLNVDTGPLNDEPENTLAWLERNTPSVPTLPSDIVCALVSPCSVPSPTLPQIPRPGELPTVPQLPPGPYCFLGTCWMPGSIPSPSTPSIPDATGWIPSAPYCLKSPTWEMCFLTDGDPTKLPTLPPPPPPPLGGGVNPCGIVVTCMFWETITSLPLGGIGGFPVTTSCGAPSRGGDGAAGWNTDGGKGGRATSDGCQTDGKHGEDGASEVLLVGCTNGQHGGDGAEGGPGGKARGGNGGNAYDGAGIVQAGNGGQAVSQGGMGGRGGDGGDGGQSAVVVCTGGDGGNGGDGGDGGEAQGGNGGVAVHVPFFYRCAVGGSASAPGNSPGSGGAGGNPGGINGVGGYESGKVGSETVGSDCPEYVP